MLTKVPLTEALAFAEEGFGPRHGSLITVGLLAGLLVKNGNREKAAELD